MLVVGFLLGGRFSGGKATPWRWFGVGGGGFVLGERFSGAKKSDLWKISKGQTAPKLGNMLKKDRWGRFGMFFVWQNFLRSSWSWNGVLSPNPIFDFEKKDNIL